MCRLVDTIGYLAKLVYHRLDCGMPVPEHMMSGSIHDPEYGYQHTILTNEHPIPCRRYAMITSYCTLISDRTIHGFDMHGPYDLQLCLHYDKCIHATTRSHGTASTARSRATPGEDHDILNLDANLSIVHRPHSLGVVAAWPA